MKIGIIGKFGPEEMGKHISDTLIDMGYDVVEFEFGPFLNQKKKNKLNKLFIKIFNIVIYSKLEIRESVLKNFFKKLKKEKIEFLISTYDYLSFFEIQELKKENKNLKIVLWFPDALSNVGRSLFMTAGYDALFFKCHHIVDYLKNYYELPVFYIGEAYNKKNNFPIKKKLKEEIDIAVVGNLHSYRLPFLEKLVALKKYKIKIFGNRPPFYIPISEELEKCFSGIYLTGEDRAEIFTNAKINLNTFHMGEVKGVNVRLFEIAGAGGFQLATYRDEIKEFFEIGKELDTFSSFKELIEKIDFYLANDKLRNKIAEAGYRKAKDRYTYQNRLEEILRITNNEN